MEDAMCRLRSSTCDALYCAAVSRNGIISILRLLLNQARKVLLQPEPPCGCRSSDEWQFFADIEGWFPDNLVRRRHRKEKRNGAQREDSAAHHVRCNPGQSGGSGSPGSEPWRVDSRGAPPAGPQGATELQFFQRAGVEEPARSRLGANRQHALCAERNL